MESRPDAFQFCYTCVQGTEQYRIVQSRAHTSIMATLLHNLIGALTSCLSRQNTTCKHILHMSDIKHLRLLRTGGDGSSTAQHPHTHTHPHTAWCDKHTRNSITPSSATKRTHTHMRHAHMRTCVSIHACAIVIATAIVSARSLTSA